MIQHKAFSADVTVVDGERAVMAKISTIAVDRDGEVLIPQGCNTKDYEKNPIVTWMHEYYALPLGKIAAIKRDAESISAKIVFASRPESHPETEEWFPDVVFSLYQQGVLSAFSVGFNSIETRPSTDRDLEKFGAGCRWVTSKWSLLEVGCVTIPCNQEAVATAVSKGFIREATAEKIFGKSEAAEPETPSEIPPVEPIEEKTATGTCAKCGKEFPMDDLQEMEGMEGEYCSDCREQMKAAKAVKPSSVHYYDPFHAKRKKSPDANVITGRVIAKAKGRIYYI